MTDIPEGWCVAEGKDLFGLVTSGSRGWAKYYSQDGAQFLRVGNLDRGTIRLDLRHVQRVKLPRRAEGLRTGTKAGDIVISITADVGMVGVAPGDLGEAYVNQHLALARPVGGFMPEYVAWYLAAREGGQRQFQKLDRGAIKSGLSLEDIRAVRVPLAPLAEQRRIVETVEALLAHIDAARRHLARVPPILKRFRQSVLAAACSGRLTEDWRGDRHNAVDPAQLLELIRGARFGAWETAERKKLESRGRALKDPEVRARYRVPDKAEAAFETPESWAWASLDELTLIAGGLTKGQKRQTGVLLRNVPYLRVANVQRGHLDLTLVKCIPATEDEITELRLEPGDILLNEGGDIDKLGRGWVWHGEVVECIHQNHVFRARPASKLVEPHFVSHYANTFGQQFFFDAGAQTVNLASVSMSKIKGLPVPIPPIDEQREILRRVNALFRLADSIQSRVGSASARADALTQSILAKAFRGDLVPTEAELARTEGRDYESAEALRSRMHRERTARALPKSPGRADRRSGTV